MLCGMTSLVLALLLMGAPQSQAPAQTPPPQPRPNPCDAAEYRHFDFWLGSWDVTNADGTRALGRNIIEPLAGNCGVHENWTGAGGATGRSLNTYDRSDRKWHQVWVGAGGGLLHLIGGLQNGAMVLEGASPGPNNTTVLNRVTWSAMPDGRVRQFWQVSADQGKTWTVSFDGYYRKQR
jgi:hypothetical protein